MPSRTSSLFPMTFALALTGCAPRSPRGDLGGGTRSHGPEPTASAAVPRPPAPAAPSSSPSTPSGYVDRTRRTGTPGSTKGTIACGDARCKAPSETCVFDEKKVAWTCLPYKPGDPDHPEPVGIACDDGTDCPAGETCCDRWEDAGEERQLCVKRADVNHLCRAEICVEGGARCPPGTTCVARASFYGDGACEAPKGPATCAGKKRCPAARPICASTDKGLACVAEGSPEYAAIPGDRRFQCTLQRDCNAGEQCSFSFGEVDHQVRTFCSKYSMPYMGSLACEPGSNDFCGKDPECHTQWACNRLDDGPPWLGVLHSK